jgi:hypothetical protein
MWKKRDVLAAGAAIIVILICWGTLRLLFPILDYYPPESLVHNLERSWFVLAGLRNATALAYVTAALVLMALFFHVVQQRWPGRRGIKGLAFGTAIGVVWTLGFLTGWAFLGTTLRAEILNSIVDFIPLAIAGWLIGTAVGRDIPPSEHEEARPWLAVLFVAFGFVSVHTVASRLVVNLIGSTSGLLLVPTTLVQIAVLAGLGIWIGGMYVVLREALPFKSNWARVALFAFGIFGHSWIWFHLFFAIEFAGILHELLLVGLIGAVGVFAGALVYEWFALTRQRAAL